MRHLFSFTFYVDMLNYLFTVGKKNLHRIKIENRFFRFDWCINIQTVKMPKKEWKQLTLGNYFHYYFIVWVGFVETYSLSLDIVLLLSFFSYFYLSLEEKFSHINASFEIIIICVSVHFKLLRLFLVFWSCYFSCIVIF